MYLSPERIGRASRVLDRIAKAYDLPRKSLLSRSRRHPIPEARHVCFYLLRTCYEMPWSVIGRLFCKDHTTVISGAETISKKASIDGDLRQLISQTAVRLLREDLAMGDCW